MPINLRELPTFTVVNVLHSENKVQLTGDFVGQAATSQWKRCYLYIAEVGLVHCRVLSAGQDGAQSVLEVWPEESGSFPLDEFVKGRAYGYLDPLEGDRAATVLNRSPQWEFAEFHPAERNDHEHCQICMALISDQVQRVGYRRRKSDLNDEWVCGPCYEKFVLANSLDLPW
jgi:hypothetical protein